MLLSITIAKGGEIRRTHKFLRPLAMGDAFTAVADSKETIAYNPAGLLIEGVEWSLTVPSFGMAYNDIAKKAMNGSLDIDMNNPSSLQNLPGTRVYTEMEIGLPYWFIPNSGIFFGLSGDVWAEFVVPKPTIVPVIHIEAVGQGVFEYGMAFEVFGIYMGANLKLIQRQGVIADVDLLSIANKTPEDIQKEYAPEQPLPKLVMDFGLLYRFDHSWNPRIGLSALDLISVDLGGEADVTYNGIDYGYAGEVKQLNSIGFAFTKEHRDFYFTGSMDFHDFSFTYFPNNDLDRRLSIGFEAAYGKRPDNAHMLAFQLGVKELRYPSVGMMARIGVLELSSIMWNENFGTKDKPQEDKRYMFLISFVF